MRARKSDSKNHEFGEYHTRHAETLLEQTADRQQKKHANNKTQASKDDGTERFLQRIPFFRGSITAMNHILLHVCCGPCSTVPLRLLVEQEASFVAFYDNPNIQPSEEYKRRRATFLQLAASQGVEVSEGFYETEGWDAAIGERAGVYPLIKDAADYAENRVRREARCRACYAYRFERLAARAAHDGFTSIATTLSISPYQFTDLMANELEAAAARHGLSSAFVDYRPFFAESVCMSRELGMYRQNYCGCRWSQAEAERERAARKAAKKHRTEGAEQNERSTRNA
jgi:predicted adenine nucleotide alpha hydrolase (AANH) superfamily ATPase